MRHPVTGLALQLLKVSRGQVSCRVRSPCLRRLGVGLKAIVFGETAWTITAHLRVINGLQQVNFYLISNGFLSSNNFIYTTAPP